MSTIRNVTILIAFAASAAPALAEEEDAAELAFNGHCRNCHSMKEGDNRLGPSMFRIMGKKAGQVAGFNYSPALKNSTIVWTDDVMDKWIENPGAVAAGNSMSPPYNGIADAEIRKHIITFMKSGGKAGDAPAEKPAPETKAE